MGRKTSLKNVNLQILCYLLNTMKIYVNRQPRNGPYGGGNMWVQAVYKHIPNMGHVLHSSEPPDVILLAGLDADDSISAEQAIAYRQHHNIKVIIRVNENDARKGTTHVDPRLLQLSKGVDGTVFVSRWLQDHFVRKGWSCLNSTVIVNGVDSSVFRRNKKFDNGKINILMAHWSDNPMKGQDYAEWLDAFVGSHSDEYTFTYIGRTKANFKNTTLIGPLHGQQLGDEIGKYDVCINASRFDPGPNSVIEPISCELPTYVHVNGGGGVEFAGTDHTFSTFEELETLLLKKQFETNSTKFSPWEETVRSYVNYIENVCRTPRR